MHLRRCRIATRRDLERAMVRALLLPPAPDLTLLELDPYVLPTAAAWEPPHLPTPRPHG